MAALAKRDIYNCNKEKPYKIESNSIEGRFLVSTRDIKAGEVILHEYPITTAPNFTTAPVCLGCYKSVCGQKGYKCSKCNWPLCGKSCEKAKDHISECDYFVANKIKIKSFSQKNEIDLKYDAIAVLRVLLKKETNSVEYECFDQLESHYDEWTKDNDWLEGHDEVIKTLTKVFKVMASKEDILRIFGVFYTNDFSTIVDSGEESANKVRLCYSMVAMCSNDCLPNTWRTIGNTDNGFKHEVTSRRKIAKGEKITLAYEDIFLPTLLRRKDLKHGKKFLCRCKRCQSVDELGSFAGSIPCGSCDGKLIPENEEYRVIFFILAAIAIHTFVLGVQVRVPLNDCE